MARKYIMCDAHDCTYVSHELGNKFFSILQRYNHENLTNTGVPKKHILCALSMHFQRAPHCSCYRSALHTLSSLSTLTEAYMYEQEVKNWSHTH